MTKLESAKERLERFNFAKNKLFTWKDRIRRIYQYVAPTRWDFNAATNSPNSKNSDSAGTAKTLQVYDATAIIGATQFANNFQTITMPPFKRWIDLSAGTQFIRNNPTQTKNVSDELTNITLMMFEKLYNSNFNQVINESLLDLFVGTAFIAVNESDGRAPFSFVSIPPNEMVFETDEEDNISNMYRMWKIPMRDAMALWDLELSANLRSKFEKNPNEEIQLVEGAIIYKENSQEKRCYYYVQPFDEATDIYSEWREDSPFIGYRYLKAPGETFGRGLADLLFPLITGLNKTVEFQLRSLKSTAFPIYIVSKQSGINPHTSRLEPGALISVNYEKGIPPIQPLQGGGNPQIAQFSVAETREMLKDLMFANPLGQVGQAPQMTATEVGLRYQDYVRRNGAAVGRLSQELIFPLIDKILRIMIRKGIVSKNLQSAPILNLNIGSQDRGVMLNYKSPLISLQDKEDVENFMSAMQIEIQLGGQGAIMSLKIEELPEWVFKKLGADTNLLEKPQVVKQRMEKIAELTQQQQQAPQPQTQPITAPVQAQQGSAQR